MFGNPDTITINTLREYMIQFLALRAHRSLESRPVEIEVLYTSQRGIRISSEVYQTIVVGNGFEAERFSGPLVARSLREFRWDQVRVPGNKNWTISAKIRVVSAVGAVNDMTGGIAVKQ